MDGVSALNPVNHYRPKSYSTFFLPFCLTVDLMYFLGTLNTFEGALDTLAQQAYSIKDIVVNYMAGLNALTQLNGL